MALSLATVGGKITAAFMNAIIGVVNKTGTTAIVPSSVTTAGGTNSIGTTGVVTFTAVSGAAGAVKVQGAFPAGYTRFRIMIEVEYMPSVSFLSLAMMDAGGTSAVGGYQTTIMYTLAAAAPARDTRTDGQLGANGIGHFINIDIMNPNVAQRTIANVNGVNVQTAGTSGTTFTSSWEHQTATAYTGFALTMTLANGQGRVSVVGYNNG